MAPLKTKEDFKNTNDSINKEDQQLVALREALIKGEQSGPATPLTHQDFEDAIIEGKRRLGLIK